MFTYFGDKVPAELRSQIDTANIATFKERDAPEDAVIFLFLALITRNIEVHLPTDGPETVKKVMQFQLHPNCMFLTRETKDTFLRTIDPDGMVDELMDYYKSFSIEMS